MVDGSVVVERKVAAAQRTGLDPESVKWLAAERALGCCGMEGERAKRVRRCCVCAVMMRMRLM